MYLAYLNSPFHSPVVWLHRSGLHRNEAGLLKLSQHYQRVTVGRAHCGSPLGAGLGIWRGGGGRRAPGLYLHTPSAQQRPQYVPAAPTLHPVPP